MVLKKLYLACAVIGLFTACSQKADDSAIKMSNVEIELNGGVSNVITRSTGIINPGDVVKNVAFLRFNGETPDWTTVTSTIEAEVSSAATNGKVIFKESQFYPELNDKVHFIAYYPAEGTTLENGVVTYSSDKMTGHEDLMYAPVISGSKDSKISTPITLSHKLALLNFKLIKGTGFPDNLSVASISVEGTSKPETLNIADGTLTFAAASSSLNVCTNATYQPSTEGTLVTETLLVQPGAQFTLTVTLSDGTSLNNIPVSAFTTIASHSHIVTLTFTQGAISVSAVISDWEDGDSTDGNVK